MHFTGLDEKTGKLMYKGSVWTGPTNLLGFFGRDPGPGTVGKRLKRAARWRRMSLKTYAFHEAVKSGLFTQEEIDTWLRTKDYQKVKRAVPAREHAGLNWKHYGGSKRRGGSSSDSGGSGKKKGGKGKRD